VEEREVQFELLHEKDYSPIRYARMCRKEEKEVPWKEIVKGYELEDGNYVVVTEEDFQSIAQEQEKIIDLIGFVDEEEIDSIFYLKPYYLEAGKGASKAYALLREALRSAGRVGLAKFTFHHKEHLGVIKPFENFLILNEIRYFTQFREVADLKEVTTKVANSEIEMALKLLDQLTTSFEPEKYHDTYTELLLEMIEKKAKGRKIEKKKVKLAEPTKTIDVMELLKKSLEQTENHKKRRKTA